MCRLSVCLSSVRRLSVTSCIVAKRYVVVGFSGYAIKFIWHQTVLSGLTYLSRHAVTYLRVRVRSVT